MAAFALCTLPLAPPSHGVDKASLLAKVANTRFDRGGLYGSGVVGLKPFFSGNLPPGFDVLYTPQELLALQELQLTERDVEARMTVKITDHYLNLALRSESLMSLVKARPEETADLAGSIDPSHQNKYSPVPGLLHKYEMVLLFAARTCSAHCRYCYRFDLFTNKSGKTVISSEDAMHYIKQFNSSPVSSRKYPNFQITEALLSGGDPMVLPNTTLAKYILDLAEAGVRTIRIGTKELAFFPYRFDTNFFAMLDMIHEAYPFLRFVFSLHFTHPAEFLEMRDGKYETIDGQEVADAHRNGGIISKKDRSSSVAYMNGGVTSENGRSSVTPHINGGVVSENGRSSTTPHVNGGIVSENGRSSTTPHLNGGVVSENGRSPTTPHKNGGVLSENGRNSIKEWRTDYTAGIGHTELSEDNEFNAAHGKKSVGSAGVANIARNYKWLEVTENAVMELNKRGHYISLRNQTPIIRKVNDNSEELAILQREMFRKGIGNHYIFQCRDIQGKREFAIPVEESWRLFTESQRGLSGVEKQARFVMSTEKGKVEVVGMFDDKVVFRLCRSSFDSHNQNIIICRSNPDALWIDDYKGHVVFDPHHVVL